MPAARHLSDSAGMPDDLELRAIYEAAIPFVEARRKKTGGFGATPGLPATVEDTYHALRILHLCRQYGMEEAADAFTDRALRSYLVAGQRFLSAGTRTIFQLLWCCRAVDLDFDQYRAAETVIARLQPSSSLEDWYYSVRIWRESGLPLETLAGKPHLAAILAHGWQGVDEALMQIFLWTSFRQSLPRSRSELVTWLQASQNGDGGFGFYPGTTSFVENCHAALGALAFLDAGPLDPMGAFYFLTDCQTAAGGFGRNHRAAPFLDATWHASAALAILCPRGRRHGSVNVLDATS